MGLGCKADILHILDEKCSNKHQCEIIHFARELKDVDTGCPTDMFRYLEADYSCESGKYSRQTINNMYIK